MIAVMLHHIRKAILDTLATADSLRYGELKPTNLDGNVFTYHLKGLITDNLVHKRADGAYTLTRLGRSYIVHRYEDVALSAHTIFLVVLQRQSQYLLRCRDVQPFLGYTGFIHGEPEAGVAVVQTAVQRLYDKTGLQNIKLSVAGTALLTQYRGDELHSCSHAIILFGQTEDDITRESDATGHNFWSDLDSVDQLLPSCHDIVAMLEAKRTWLEKTYKIE